MFRKLNLKLSDKIIDTVIKLQKFIDVGKVLYQDDTIKFCFKKYEPETDEYKLLKQYENKYTIYKQVEFIYKPILKLIPESALKLEIPHVHWQTFNGGSLVPPHIDKGRISTINIYTQVNGEKTIVYDKLRNGARLETENGIVTNESFIPEWIKEKDSFVANEWDAYALDVSNPHSVVNMTLKPRISISFSFYQTSYEKLIDLVD